jgi:serine/threonine protein kinase
VILGTAAYISPEQARGKRAEIWAFGVLLDEMLTGEHVFNGETTSDTLAAVIKTEPNWDALPASIPASIRKMLRSVTPGLQARKRGSPDAYPDPLKGGSFRVGDDTGVGG